MWSACFSFMGAADAATRDAVLKAFKQVRNQTNRQTNCDTANLGKTARANAQTLKAIRYLQEQHALETLCRRCCSRQQPSVCNTRIFRLPRCAAALTRQ
ncbi:MAG: helix-turn-helix domain-containing protein [Faecalibacterium prausnitzii]